MNRREIKYLQVLNDIVRVEIGRDCKWRSLVHLHEYLKKRKREGEKDFRTIPIDFAIKYTKPLQPEQGRKKKPVPPPPIPFENTGKKKYKFHKNKLIVTTI
jgi:hypothetical protein